MLCVVGFLKCIKCYEILSIPHWAIHTQTETQMESEAFKTHSWTDPRELRMVYNDMLKWAVIFFTAHLSISLYTILSSLGSVQECVLNASDSIWVSVWVWMAQWGILIPYIPPKSFVFFWGACNNFGSGSSLGFVLYLAFRNSVKLSLWIFIYN